MTRVESPLPTSPVDPPVATRGTDKTMVTKTANFQNSDRDLTPTGVPGPVPGIQFRIVAEKTLLTNVSGSLTTSSGMRWVSPSTE